MSKAKCAGCKYWRKLGSSESTQNMACHHLLDTRHRREMDGDNCLSYEPKRKSEFPARLRKLREERRQSRVALSELCGLSRGMIRQYERGEKIPTLKTLIVLANYFGVSIDYLAGETNNRKRSL